jgi:phage host-nuclease inhibitor protein Gam
LLIGANEQNALGTMTSIGIDMAAKVRNHITNQVANVHQAIFKETKGLQDNMNTHHENLANSMADFHKTMTAHMETMVKGASQASFQASTKNLQNSGTNVKNK